MLGWRGDDIYIKGYVKRKRERWSDDLFFCLAMLFLVVERSGKVEGLCFEIKSASRRETSEHDLVVE